MTFRLYGCSKQVVDEVDFSPDAWLFVVDVHLLDGSNRFYSAQGRFG